MWGCVILREWDKFSKTVDKPRITVDNCRNMWTSTAKRPHFKLHLKNLPPIYGGLICTSPIYDPSPLSPFLPNCALGNAHTYLQLSTGQAVNNLSRIRPSRDLIMDTCDGLPPQLRQNFPFHFISPLIHSPY